MVYELEWGDQNGARAIGKTRLVSDGSRVFPSVFGQHGQGVLFWGSHTTRRLQEKAVCADEASDEDVELGIGDGFEGRIGLRPEFIGSP